LRQKVSRYDKTANDQSYLDNLLKQVDDLNDEINTQM